ncbi:MAG: YhjD/YihY/BrkB family envelope integrity protein, partial [Bifidobacterium longum]|nr:YhjD/YihY/BrkB family envelope integrity protein [Bifidobacterium longum]
MHGLKSAIDRGADACARSLPGRVLDRYVSRNGPLLANGLAYGLLFAFFAGIWIAVSVLGLIMVGNIDWQQMLIDAVREVIPGMADSFLTSSALNTMSSTLTWTGLATLAIFWWTVTGWMNSLRHAVRAMFDDCGDELNIVVARLRDT